MSDNRPVNRWLSAGAGALVVLCGLYLIDQVIYMPTLRERSPGAWTASGAVLLLIIALVGAGIAAFFDRVQRPRGIFVLGLALLGLSLVLNLIAMPGITEFFKHPKELFFAAAAAGLLGYAWHAVIRARLVLSLGFIAGFLFLAFVWTVYAFDLIFSQHPARQLLSALFMATLFGGAVRVRRRLLRPLRWDLAAVVAALLVAAVGHVGVHQYLASRGCPPQPSGDGIEWSKPSRPFLVLVVWDTVRRDHVSLYGYSRKTTPLLEQWSREAKVFTDARTVATWTLPSHASMMTGLYFRSHGSGWAYQAKREGVQVPLNEQFVTLAELLAKSGYVTGGIAANNACAGRLAGMDQGFEYFYDHDNARPLDWPLFDLQSWLVEVLSPLIPPRFFSPYMIPNMPAEEVTDRALGWIDSLDKDRPFFLFLNYMDAHEPTFPPEDLRYLFPGFQRDLINANIKNRFLEVFEQERPLTEREREHIISQYDAQIVRLDRETDRLRRGLERRGILDQAVFLLVSDHGEFFGEHGKIWHGNDVYDELTRVPMVVRLPGGAEAGADPRLIESREIFYLMLGKAGVKAPVSPAMNGQVAENYPEYRVSKKTGKHLNSLTRRAVVFAGYKYIRSSDGNDELFDLINDPRESRNLLASSPPQLGQGRSLMDYFLETFPEAKVEVDPDQPLDPEHERKLRALGYIQ